jgi:hypothetical protein
MTQFQVPYTALASIISIAGLCWLMFWLYPDFLNDFFRQRMFAVRDCLFDDALAGKISFDHPAYKELRKVMNGFILQADRMSLFEFALFLVFTRGLPRTEDLDSFDRRWERVTRGLDEPTRMLLEDYRRRMHVLLLKHVIWRSPILLMSMATIIPFLVCLIFGRVWINNLVSILAKELSRIDGAASAIGGNSLLAAA